MSSSARSSPPQPKRSNTEPGASRRRDSRTFSALGSSVRIRILEATSADGRSIPELARELGVRPVTLRYHLNYLRNQGLIEEVDAAGPRKVGRPAILYRATRHARIGGFPERHFDFLGQLAMEAFVDTAGPEAASLSLREKGATVGRAMVEEVRRREDIVVWTPDTFERLVLEGVFRDFGVVSEVVSRSPDALVYRSFTCPFLELAEKMPEMVCNALDLGFHAGVDVALSGAETERLACMGHGDPYCEYRVSWAGGSRPRPPRRGVVRRSGGRKHE